MFFSAKNLSAGFVVFLLALPLSIGISLASGCPPAAGLIAAFVGGMIGSVLGGSELTINGPAAGLIVIVADAVISLGQGNPMQGYKMMLAATVVAGCLQVISGKAGIAKYGILFPGAVIHGMLSAIGAIIIAKQTHVLLGVTPTNKSIIGLIGEIPFSFAKANPEIAAIGAVSLILMLFLDKRQRLKWLPTPLIVVGIGVAMARFFDLEHSHHVQMFSQDYLVDQKFLLSIPSNLKEAFVLPDFSHFNSWEFFKASLVIAIVASLESTLSTHAVDQLDPKKRKSNLDRDLTAKGVCNIVSASLGGLPIISEILRSTANINQGAVSRGSNFFHGFFILLFLCLFPTLLHEIPLACLAALLMFVGWKLTHPNHFIKAGKAGQQFLAVFVTTFAVTILTDLLVGVFSGLVLHFVLTYAVKLNPWRDKTIETQDPAKAENIYGE